MGGSASKQEGGNCPEEQKGADGICRSVVPAVGGGRRRGRKSRRKKSRNKRKKSRSKRRKRKSSRRRR